MSERMTRRELERAVRNQGVVLVVTVAAVFVTVAALFRKGVLTPKDLLADG